MTYCVAARLNSGLVFLSDSRTNAGVDQISVYRKLKVLERPGERVMVLMTSGNLAISQAVVDALSHHDDSHPDSIWNAPSMIEAARRQGKRVSVITTESRPDNEGLTTLPRMQSMGVPVTVGVVP